MDTSIVLRTKRGDVSAFTELYNHTHDKAYSVAYSIMKDEFEAEDIVQEAYIVVMEKMDDLKNPERFESWFYQIVRTRSLNDLKKKRPTTFSSLATIDNPEIQFVDTLESDYKPFNPEAAVDEAETRRLVRDMVFSLPEMQKKCILMRYQGDMKVCDIAKELNIPESTVKSNLNYGKKKIEDSVRKMEQKGVKLYSFSPVLVLPLIREALYMGLASASGRDNGDSGSGSVLAEAGKEGVRVIVRRVVAAICATFAIGGASVGLSRQPTSPPESTAAVIQETAAAVSEPPAEVYTVPENVEADALLTVWKEGSFPGSVPNTYRLPALALGYGDDSAFKVWGSKLYQYLSMNLDEYYNVYMRDQYHFEGDLHFDNVSEIFGNVLTVMCTVNDYPSGCDPISYDLTTGRKMTMNQLAAYGGLSREFLEEQIHHALQAHWDSEDGQYGRLPEVDGLRERTLASDLWGTTDILITPACPGNEEIPPEYGSITLRIPVRYFIADNDTGLEVIETTDSDYVYSYLNISAADF